MTLYVNNIISSWSDCATPTNLQSKWDKMSYWSLHMQREDCPEMFTHHSNGHHSKVNSSTLMSWTLMYEAQDHQCLPIPGINRGACRRVFSFMERKGRGKGWWWVARETYRQWVRERKPEPRTNDVSLGLFCHLLVLQKSIARPCSEKLLSESPSVPVFTYFWDHVGHQTLNNHDSLIAISSSLFCLATSICAMLHVSSWPPISCRGLRSTMLSIGAK